MSGILDTLLGDLDAAHNNLRAALKRKDTMSAFAHYTTYVSVQTMIVDAIEHDENMHVLDEWEMHSHGPVI